MGNKLEGHTVAQIKLDWWSFMDGVSSLLPTPHRRMLPFRGSSWEMKLGAVPTDDNEALSQSLSPSSGISIHPLPSFLLPPISLNI